MTRDVCAQLAGITLCGSVRPADPGAYTGKGPTLGGRQICDARRPVGIPSSVVRHSFGCALPTRDSACDCTTPDLRTSSRGFTYDLGQMLGEGWYGEDSGA